MCVCMGGKANMICMIGMQSRGLTCAHVRYCRAQVIEVAEPAKKAGETGKKKAKAAAAAQ